MAVVSGLASPPLTFTSHNHRLLLPLPILAMGSGSSRMVPRTPRHRPRSRQRDRIAAFICGGAAAFSHDDSPQIEDKLEEKSVIQSRSDDSAKISNILIAVSESSPKYSQKYGSTNEGISIGKSNNNDNECSFQSCLEIIHPERNPNQPSTSKKPVERIDTSLSSREIDNCTNVNDYHSSTNFSSSIQKIELEDSHENHFNLSSDALSIPSTNTSHVSVIPNCPSTLHVPNEDPLGSTSSSSNVTASTGSYEHRNGSVLHVDLVSISSDVLEGSGERTNGESQRDTRRLFLDAFARHSSRDVHSAMLLSSADTNTLGYRNRWPLDIVDPASAEEVEDDSVYLRRRRHGLNGVSWNSRSEIRERLHSGFGDSNGHISSCPSGLHHDGTCSCTLLETEASSARASIARIFVLAEALFEVLDEIHRQPGSLLFSVVTVPASESIVNTLPSKIHKRVDTVLSNDDVEQCYICLADYEDGDKIRILPCHHEYHASCVDKWLKEIHGVCPLCRRDVCEAVSQSSISSL